MDLKSILSGIKCITKLRALICSHGFRFVFERFRKTSVYSVDKEREPIWYIYGII